MPNKMNICQLLFSPENTLAKKLDFVSPESPDVIFENYLDVDKDASIEDIAAASDWFALSDTMENH